MWLPRTESEPMAKAAEESISGLTRKNFLVTITKNNKRGFLTFTKNGRNMKCTVRGRRTKMRGKRKTRKSRVSEIIKL